MNKIQINPHIDLESCRDKYLKDGRVRIANFFTDDSADYLLDLIVKHEIWYFAYNNNDQYYESTVEDVRALPEKTYNQFMGNIEARASNNFQYAFNQYHISQAIAYKENIGSPIHSVDAYFNSDAFLASMKKITLDKDIVKADSYISSFQNRHFLTSHDDNHQKHNRSAAFTLGMTKQWNKNWGGYLEFYDSIDNIKEAFKPSFNTLILFSVPQEHAVQQVTSFAQKDRLSYLGWLLR